MPMPTLRVSISGDSPWTVTDSSTLPSSRAALMVGLPVHLQHDAGLHERAEALQHELQPVGAHRKIRDGVTAFLVGDDRPRETGVGLRGRDGDTWQDAAARIADRARDGGGRGTCANAIDAANSEANKVPRRHRLNRRMSDMSGTLRPHSTHVVGIFSGEIDGNCAAAVGCRQTRRSGGRRSGGALSRNLDIAGKLHPLP